MERRTFRAYTFPMANEVRDRKPRRGGITEIRGPYFNIMGSSYLEDIMETQGQFVDSLKFSGGAFSLMPKDRVKRITALAHRHGVHVNSGGWAEHMLKKGSGFFNQYVQECKDMGFDIIELGTDFLDMEEAELMRLIRLAKSSGLQVKPELAFEVGRLPLLPKFFEKTAKVQTEAEELETMIRKAERCLEAGAEMIMVDGQGLTQDVPSWRTDVLADIINRLGLERTMFEAHEPNLIEWFYENYGPQVNLFVNHSDVMTLQRLRSGNRKRSRFVSL